MAVAAATEAANTHGCTSATSAILAHAEAAPARSAVETVIVHAVLHQMSATASLSNTSAHVSRGSASGPSSGLTPSSLEAPPWDLPATTINTITIAPSSSAVAATTTSFAGQRPGPALYPQPLPGCTSSSLLLLLPAVLSTQRGIARVDALHPTFVLHLLTALLQAGCGCAGGEGALLLTQSPTRLSNGQPATTAGGDEEEDLRRAGYRDTFLQLLNLYAPLLLSRLQGAGAAVEELVTLISQEATPTASADGAKAEGRRTKFAECVRRHFAPSPTQPWVEALGAFVASTIEVLSTRSRNVARTASLHADTGTAAAAITTACHATPNKASNGSTPLGKAEVRQGSLPSAAPPTATETEEAVWILKTLGTVLLLLDPSSPDRVVAANGGRGGGGDRRDAELAPGEGIASFASEDAGVANRAELEASPADVSEHKLSEWCPLKPHHRHNSSRAEGVVLATVLSRMCQRQLLLIGASNDDDDVDVLMSQVTAVASLIQRLLMRNGEWHGDAIIEGTCSADTLVDHYAALYTSQLAEQQKQQHRLLAAAERAVQHVLRLSTTPWRSSPAMLVAMCGITSYQLRTQLRQRQQRLLVLESERDGNARAHDAPDTCYEAEAASSSSLVLPNTAAPTSAAQPIFFGEAVWSDDEAAEGKKPAEGPIHTFGETATTKTSVSYNATIAAAPFPSPSASSSARRCPTSVPPVSPVRQPTQRCLYTPRTSLLGCSAPTRETADTAEDYDASLSDPVRYFSATRSMEHLWELPPRVPQEWTPALATLMTCCALCITPTSTVASRLCVLAGDPFPEEGGAEEDEAAGGGAGPASFAVASLPSAPSSTRASPRPSLLDFGFGRRRAAPATPQNTHTAGSNSGNDCTSAGGERERSGTTQAPPTGSRSSDAVVVVGALAQWHLRGLIQQLRIPARGVEPRLRGCTGEMRAVGGRTTTVTNGVFPSGLSATAVAVPSSAGATGGASWFTAYHHANKSARPRPQPQHRRDAASSTGAASAPKGLDHDASVVVLRALNPTLLLASCFALQHLLRTQHHFFAHAQLGGSAMRELRRGVVASRRVAGGTAGWTAGMLQCVPTAYPSGRGGGGGGGQESSAPHSLRSRSLWVDVGVRGQGGDRSTTAVLDAALQDNGESDNHTHSSDDDDDAASARPRLHSEGGSAMTTGTGEGEKDAHRASAGTCALTEAVLVAVAFLGSRVVAVALPLLHASAQATGAAAQCQRQWLDALQALAGLLLDTHRVHRSRYKLELQRLVGGDVRSSNSSKSNAFASSVNGDTGAARRSNEAVSASPLPDAWRAASVGSPREGFAGPLRTSSHGDAGRSPTSPTPPRFATHVPTAPSPSLSIEAQFGVGTFFVALVRALLQLHVQRHNSGGDDGASTAETAMAQCVFAVASVISDLLQDYTQHPPVALCDVLAMLSVIQLPSSPAAVPADQEPAGRAAPTVWQALRASPYWDTQRLGALECASRAWNAPPEPSPPLPERRCSSVVSDSTVPPALPAAPPRESLLGHVPCSRDPTSMSWLPTTLSSARRNDDTMELSSAHGGVHHARGLLDLMAEEEALLLTTKRAAAAQCASVTGEGNLAEDESQQLAIAVVSSRRYAWALSRLQLSWSDALTEALFAGR
ncbi:hypothetical protein ABB37_08835 [Leptomonas pyrrhocoris]|uniref:Uncharacterized protein n=1 Tax=Leptomonas pyrrhocoris TaxID=157538 RepID=A0A0M9FSK2_LEPPY|nr:hypothetical protein ABB37_08835 [Leptomonas pyrrhocoris]KPA75173.1 hypothetical protein ABB37_08835 [Leptomonas pyrrhocoris]|eukprot:XP_015653612.1 hypothetical protein ABB37_08835 [Leptomonas pyrrhocoris]